MTQTKHMSDETARLIDQEVRILIDRNYDRAKKILEDNMDIMHAMKDALMKYETIDAGQIEDLMNRCETIRPPQGWTDSEAKPAEPAPQAEEVKVEPKVEPVNTPDDTESNNKDS